MILRYIKMWVERYLCCEQISLPKEPCILILLAADYGNVGDIAITCSQETFLKQQYPSRPIIKIPLKKTYRYYKSIKKQLKKEDIITTIGGGNMGDLYYGFELKRQFVIKHFQDHKMISFPQSIYFTNSYLGKKRQEHSQKIYSKHPDLTIVARESYSYEVMKELFSKNKVILTPDIVFSYVYSEPEKRDKITICLRNDKERKINDSEYQTIMTSISAQFSNIQQIDTHLGEIDVVGKETEIFHQKLKQFAESKVVITDRLHGMIFCAITKTPCIVLANNNYKIEKTYHDWLKNTPWITFLEDPTPSNIISHLKDHLENPFPEKAVTLTKEFLPLIEESRDVE